jgi:cyclopropane-fatty-acyl-phospholipid synthase
MMRALWKHDVNVVGLTLSKNQALHVRNLLDACESVRSKRVLLEGWEQFHEPVDRIVSIGAFEHFGAERYGRFFGMAHDVLPPDGIRPSREDYLQRKLSIRMRHIPGGELPQSKDVIDHASVAGFTLERVQSLRMHYARTLECWAAALERNRDRPVAIQSQEVYERYMKYLTGCVELFRKGYIDICQFTLAKSV